MLQLTTPVDSGEIVFSSGRVVAAYRTGSTRSAGDGLLAAGAVSPTTYQELLAAQAAGALGTEMFTRCGVDPEILDSAMQGLLKSAIFEMFDWDEGAFSFVLEEDPDPWRGFSLSGTRVVSSSGLNPQYLAIEGARLRDERTKEDSLESFLRQRDAPAKPRTLDVETFAAKLRERSEDPLELTPGPVAALAARVQPAAAPASASGEGDADEKVIPFPSGRARRDARLRVVAAEEITGDPASPTWEPAPPAADAPRSFEAAAPAPIAPPAADAPRGLDAAAPAPAALPAVAVAGAAAPGWTVLVIDDDPQVTRHVGNALRGRVARLQAANTVAEALPQIEEADSALVVVSDLIIARSDGAGILGGIEVLEKVRRISADAPVLLFSDYENAEAEQRARKLGIAGFLMKPRKAQMAAKEKGAASQAMRDFVERLTAALGDYLGPPGAFAGAPEPLTDPAPAAPQSTPELASAAEPASSAPEQGDVPATSPAAEPVTGAAPHRAAVEVTASYDLRREINAELPDLDLPYDADLPPIAELAGPIGVLRSMLTELVDPANRDTITLLVLRFASNALERAGLFLVTRRAFIGLGGFSVDEASDHFVACVRKIQIPVELESIFGRVAKYKAPIRGSLDRSEGNERLVVGIGGRWPEGESIAIPIISNDRVAAILYGDNPSGKELGPTDTLEIFLQQAGLAMDRALLERKLEESRRKRGG